MLRGLAAQHAASQIVEYIGDYLRYDGINDPGRTRVTCRSNRDGTEWTFVVWHLDVNVAELPLGEYLGRAGVGGALLGAVREIRKQCNEREGLRWPKV